MENQEQIQAQAQAQITAIQTESSTWLSRWWNEWRQMPLAEKLARVMLAMFHPMTVAVYLVLLMLFGRMLTIHMSLRLNLHVLMIVLVNNVLIPCVYMLLVKVARSGRFDWISGYSVKHERALLFLMLAIGFGASAWNFKGVEMFFLFRRIMVALMMCVILAGVLDCFKRADYHAVGMGAMTGAVWIMIYAGYEKMVVPFCVILLCSGLVASASVYLSRSTLVRVTMNYLTAAFLAAFTILLA